MPDTELGKVTNDACGRVVGNLNPHLIALRQSCPSTKVVSVAIDLQGFAPQVPEQVYEFFRVRQ